MIGSMFREYRLRKNYTQQKLADEIGVSVQFIAKIEGGYDVPSLEILKKLCRKLSMNLQQMIKLIIEFKVENYKNKIRKKYNS